MPDGRLFHPDDPDFPMSPALQQRLRDQGRVLETPPARPAPLPAPKAETTVAATVPAPGGDGITLGVDDRGAAVRIQLAKLLAGRLLVQGMSGAGKSYTLRRLVEEAHPHTTIAIVDPEGEFANLAAHIGAVTVKGAETPPDALTALALRCRQHRAHVHLDLSDLEAEARIEAAAAFFGGLVASPRELWDHTVLVMIDEAHLLAPHAAASARDAEIRRAGVAALTDLCSRGRKRGLAPVIATQRLAKLAASVLAELHNVIVGINMLDRDIQRAADVLGWTVDKAGLLRDLQPGQFVCLGPAIAAYPTVVRVAATQTRHLGHTPALLASAGLNADQAREALQVDLIATGRPAAPPAKGGRGHAALDSFLLAPGAAEAARALGALATITPNATTAQQLGQHLGLADAAVQEALDLLASVGAVETIPRGPDRIARLSARLRAQISTPVVGLS